MIKTRVGNLVRVENQDKKKGANKEYMAVILKTQNGQYNQYLFTDVELDVAWSRARKNTEDVVERSFASKMLD